MKDTLFLKTIAAGLAGIYEMGQPYGYAWNYVAELNNDEMVFVFKEYTNYKEAVKKGLEEGTYVAYDKYNPEFVCSRSTLEYYKKNYENIV